MSGEGTRIALIFVLLGFVFVRNLRGFLLFLQPGKVRERIVGQRIETDDPAIRLMLREVENLGFSPLGTIEERRPVSSAVELSVLAGERGGEYAVVFPKRRGAWLYYLTLPRQGAYILTADHHWPATESETFITGGLPGASPEELLATHRRRAGTIASEAPAEPDLPAFAEALEGFHAKGPGKRELRRQSTRSFLFASAAILWGAMTAWGLFSDPT